MERHCSLKFAAGRSAIYTNPFEHVEFPGCTVWCPGSQPVLPTLTFDVERHCSLKFARDFAGCNHVPVSGSALGLGRALLIEVRCRQECRLQKPV